MSRLLDGYFGLIRKFIPTKKEGSAVGLDIGTNSCKLVELIAKGDGYQVLDWSIIPVGGDDPAAAVKASLNKLRNPVENIFTSIYGKGTLIRYIDMPRMSLEDLRNSFAIEADKYFPFTQDQIYTDCYILDPSGKSKQMKVMAAAAKKELVDARLKMMSDLGIEADLIGINPVALANARSVVVPTESQPEAVGLIDMGETVSSLTIMVGNMPKFNRDIYIGGRDLTKRIANALAVDFAEAERLKCSPGERKDEIAAINDSAIQNLIQEVRLSFDYFSTENNMDVSELIFTGGASQLTDLLDSFEQTLGVKASSWNPFAYLTVSDQVTIQDLEKNSNRLGVALGLALYQYDND